jgi:hypothetical protein
LAKASAKSSTNERFQAEGIKGEAGNMFAVELDLTMPEGLVAAGLCRDKGEARQFLHRILGGAMLASMTEISTKGEGDLDIGPVEAMYHVLNTGYLIGLASAGHRKGGAV